MFLTQFDVHTGYELKWLKTLDDITYELKDLEFKSLPSGLHSVDTDTICFIQNKNNTSDYLYGISIFKQNNHLQQLDFHGEVDRSKVKLFSLGILIDPMHLEKDPNYNNWKPKIYSICWNFKPALSQLLSNFMNSINKEQEDEFFDKFTKFFNENSYKISTTLNSNINQITGNNNNTNNNLKLEPINELKLTKLKSSSSSSLLNELQTSNDHMINALLPFIKNFGPLIFKIWKISLLRKAIIMYSPYNSSNVCINRNDEIQHDNFKIGEMSKFLYCISLISSIPLEIQDKLKDSINSIHQSYNFNHICNYNVDDLLFNKPIYNVCVNDIFQLVNLDSNYLASTTDQIIIEKRNLYDYSIKLPLNQCNKNLSIPEIKNDITESLEYATFRDHERFKIIYSKLNNNNIDENIINLSDNVAETRSIQELIWNGLAWWATAGESYKSINEEYSIEFDCFDNISNDDTDKVITIVGYFQKLTIKLFEILIELISKLENKSDVLVLDANDLIEMGLDPYSVSDRSFIVELVKIWWKKDVKISSYFTDLCYWS